MQNLQEKIRQTGEAVDGFSTGRTVLELLYLQQEKPYRIKFLQQMRSKQMSYEELREEVDYLMGQVHGLGDGEAEDEGARIENDRNRVDIQKNLSKIRALEERIEDLEEENQFLRKRLEEVER